MTKTAQGDENLGDLIADLVLGLNKSSHDIADSLLDGHADRIEDLQQLVTEMAGALHRLWNHEGAGMGSEVADLLMRADVACYTRPVRPSNAQREGDSVA